MKRKAFKAALPYSLPICVGFLFIAVSYGFFHPVPLYLSSMAMP